MSKGTILCQEFGRVLFARGEVTYGDMIEAVGLLTVGMFIKTNFGSEEERMEAFNEYCDHVRAVIEEEVAAGNADDGMLQ